MTTLLLTFLAAILQAQDLYLAHPADPGFNSFGVPLQVTPGMRVLFQTSSAECIESDRTTLDIFPLGYDRGYPARILTPPGACLRVLEALLPADLPLGPAEAVLTTGEQTSSPAALSIVPTRFALLQDTLFSLTHPAAPGARVRVRGAGLGNATLGQLTIEIGGVTARPLSVRPISAEPGLVEIEFDIPSNILLTGCYVPLSVSVSGQALNTIPIPISRIPGPCAHRLGLTADQLRTLDEGGTIPLALLRVSSRILAFSSITSGTVGSGIIAGITGFERLPFTAGCELQPSTFAGAVDFGPARESSANPAPLDFGEPVSITSPQGQAISLDNLSFFNVLPVGVLVPSAFLPATTYPAGNWRLTAPGSDTLPPLEWQFRVPEPIDIPNLSADALLRDQVNTTITWNGASYLENEWIHLTLTANTFTHQLECRAQARSGRMELRIADLLKLTGPFRRGLFSYVNVGLRRQPRHDTFPFRLRDGTPAIGVYSTEP